MSFFTSRRAGNPLETIRALAVVVFALVLSMTDARALVFTNVPGPYTVANNNDVIIVNSTDPWVGTNYLNTSPGKTLYYRFSMKWNPGARQYGGLELYNNGNEVFGTGDNTPSGNWSCFYYVGGTEFDFDLNPATPVVASQWHTFVVKIAFNQGADDTETIWMDPDFNQPEDGQSSSIITTNGFDAAFNQVRLRAGTSATYSNIVFASTSHCLRSPSKGRTKHCPAGDNPRQEINKGASFPIFGELTGTS